MIVGFNHNFLYRGEVYHVQTEDGGLKSPNIVTLLYQGGTILASKKTSYSDIMRVDNLEKVVEDLMKEQHKEMLRRLRAGEFDDAIQRLQGGSTAGAPKAAAAAVSPPVAAPPEPPVAAEPPVAEPAPVEPLPPAPAAAAPTPVAEAAPPAPPPDQQKDELPELSLDDVILSYLVGDDKD